MKKVKKSYFNTLNCFLLSEYEEVEIHSRKIYNIQAERSGANKTAEDLIGPMVNT